MSLFSRLKHNPFVHITNSSGDILNKAVEIFVTTIIIGVGGFFVALTIPPAITAIATAVLVSVNPAIVTFFQQVTEVSVIGVVIVIYVALIYHVITRSV